MYEYVFIVGIILGIDVAMAAARYEMYGELKSMDIYKATEVPLGTYSSVCFYLIPDSDMIKITKKLPMTYLFDRKIREMLKNKTYNGEPILEILEAIKKIRWEDIKDKPISIGR